MLERSHLESYICYCKYQKNLNNKTLKAYRIDLMQFFSWFFPYDACVSSTHIELYIEHLAKTYKTSTVKRKIAAIKSFYQYLIYKEYLEHSPFVKLQVHLRQERLLPRTIDNYTLSRIFSAAYSDLRESQSNNHYFVSMRDVAVLELLFATGVRVSELCSITCENSVLSNQSSETLVFSRKIGILILVPYVFSLVFALMSRNKGNFLFRLPRPPYQAVLRKFVSLPS